MEISHFPSCEGGEMPKAWGGCFLVTVFCEPSKTKEQPTSYAKASEAKARSLRSPLRRGGRAS
jgi:hypothetical protein